MRSKFILLVCLAAIILFGFTIHSITVDLTGRLKKRPRDVRHEVSGVTVFVKGKNQVLAQAISNSKGIFHLTWNDNNAKAYYFYCVLAKDTLLLAKVSTFESDTPDLTFFLPDQVPQQK